VINTLEDIAALSESVELECKLAAGQDGKGKLPADLWTTYSAFANTHGGVILLGVREKPIGRFHLEGVSNPQRLITDLFNTLNNPSKVNCNLLSDRNVQQIELDGKILLLIRVPAAGRKQKPVYLNGNPLNGNTYRRLHQGDRKCDNATVQRMLAEQVQDSLDTRILHGFALDDLDKDTLHAYRNMLASHKPDHPWNTPDDAEFLRLIGGLRKDRETGEQGLSLAALLMFGHGTAITEAAPYYFLDYQELPEQRDTDTRWLDRVVPDGAWSGNLFDFYRRVSRKLMADLKVPFVLKNGIRQDDTPQHKGLREALVNTLVHADYLDRASIRIQKWPSGFEFRNPGVLRVPAELALQGGESDCRNRTLQQMFLMLGLGERAGSGLPKIRDAWENVGFKISLTDTFEPYDQTLLRIERGEQASALKTTRKTTQKTTQKTTAKQRAILEFIQNNPQASRRDIAEALGDITSDGVKYHLHKLQQAGVLTRVGADKGGYWQVLDVGGQADE